MNQAMMMTYLPNVEPSSVQFPRYSRHSHYVIVNFISKVLTVCLNVRFLRPNDPNLLKLYIAPFLRLSSLDPSILFQNHPT